MMWATPETKFVNCEKRSVTMDKLDFGNALTWAREKKIAIGAFNIFNYESARSAIKYADSMNMPIILQTSTLTVKNFGVSEMGKVLRVLKEEAKTNVLIHLDHCRSVELAKKCIDSGWDSIMIDASHLPFEENVNITKEIVKYAHSKNVEVEGELGTILGVEDDISHLEGRRAGFDESVLFINETSVDAFAPAIGTAHGLYKGQPNIDFELVQKLTAATDCPVVIHGGTGLSEDTYRKLIRFGASKINISTALKHVYINASREYLNTNLESFNPMKFDEYVSEKIQETVGYHMALFASM
jgi:ketose-bisphosphate aldolase